jgi:hypothetical protein
MTGEMFIHIPKSAGDKRERLLASIAEGLIIDGVRIGAGYYEVTLRKVPKKEALGVLKRCGVSVKE